MTRRSFANVCLGLDEGDEALDGHALLLVDLVARGGEAEGVDAEHLVGVEGDLVAAEQEAERDEQTAAGHERDHVADAREQGPLRGAAEAAACGGGGGPCWRHGTLS